MDRSAAYFARFVARQIVLRGLAECAEIQIAYAIGVAQPVSLHVNTRGTGDGKLAEQYARRFDFRPAAIIEQLDLLKPIYRTTTNYGHFGKPALKWELSVVLDHIRKTRPKKALVITDGFVERPDGSALIACNIEAIIPATGTPEVLKEYGIPVNTLAPIH